MRRNPHAGHLSSGGQSLNVFTRDELSDIHLSTLEVLQHTGIWVEDAEALDVFASGGAVVDREAKIVRIPPYVVEDAIRSAPPTITLCGRTAASDVVIESGRVGFTNFGEGIKITDMDSGELREPTKRDVAEAARLIDALPEVDVLERPMGAHDVPQDAVPLHNAEAIFANTSKHVFIGPINGRLLEKIVEMAEVVVGGVEALRQRPLVSFNTCPVSPLKLVRDACEIIIVGARAGVPVNVLSMAMAGGSSPVSMAGTLVTHNAEVLAGITLAQLAAPGAPVIYGSSTTAMDLRFASASVGSPECAMINAGVACLARFYLLPSWVAGA
jgi:trimethylamine---corrinoid protein Co-methyltransferase